MAPRQCQPACKGNGKRHPMHTHGGSRARSPMPCRYDQLRQYLQERGLHANSTFGRKLGQTSGQWKSIDVFVHKDHVQRPCELQGGPSRNHGSVNRESGTCRCCTNDEINCLLCVYGEGIGARRGIRMRLARYRQHISSTRGVGQHLQR